MWCCLPLLDGTAVSSLLLGCAAFLLVGVAAFHRLLLCGAASPWGCVLPFTLAGKNDFYIQLNHVTKLKTPSTRK